MNSVNILSAVASAPSTSPQPSRSASTSALTPTTDCNKRNSIESEKEPDRGNTSNTSYRDSGEEGRNSASQGADYSMEIDEQTPLLGEAHVEHFSDVKSTTGWAGIPKRFSSAFVGTIRVVVTTVAIPLRYVVACLFDEQGHFSPLLPFFSIYRVFAPRRRKRSQHSMSDSEKTDTSWDRKSGKLTHQSDRPPSIASASTIVATDSEMDEKLGILGDEESRQPSKSGRTRSSMSSGDEISPARRSIRIKLHNDEMIKRKRQQLQDIGSGQASNEDVKDMMAATLKSPSSPGLSKLTKFPRAPAPPRPLIPRRQPSYSNAAHHGPHQKTLIIDLDETLIHSHSKGGRFATGHMVEVKIQQSVGVGGQFLGPQVPILYYVHKRPHCDEFLRKVSKWYNLVIFTASVQEYADPVIDWLELERSYFSGRYYRQHCTNRNGAYIKDLSQVEPDLSRVMIVDNSPVSYIFHEDNAIPIEGWISDPTDNDLLNLIPILEGLSHVTDVRALLALRLGQPSGDGS